MTERTQTSGVWTRFDYEDGTTLWQRECPYCDKGLLYAPVRFCQRCDGSGYLVRSTDPDGD